MNKIVRICVAGKPLEDSVSMFIYMDQERVNFAWQGNRQELAPSPNGVKARKTVKVHIQ